MINHLRAQLTQKQWLLLAAGGSGALMLGALAFQYIGGLAPCKMCIWQRYPHIIAIALGALALAVQNRSVMFLGALASGVTSFIGFYHAGVEQGWFEGPTTCTSNGLSGISSQDLMDQIMSAPLIRCDDIAWEFLGLSMAGWNGVLSLGLCAAWLMAASSKR